MEHDICSLILSVDVLVDKAILEGSGAERVFLVDEEQQQQQQQQLAVTATATAKPVPTATNRLAGNHSAPKRAELERWADGRGVVPLSIVNDGGRAPIGTVQTSAGMHKKALPEMLRLGDSLER